MSNDSAADAVNPQPFPETPTAIDQPAPGRRPRLASLDHLRGLTVASMIVVNFSGGFKAMPEIIKHHDGYETLADWIMPAFLFMVGFSFRLSWLSSLKRAGTSSTVAKFLIRGLLLVGISLFLYAGEDDIKIESWKATDLPALKKLLATTIKANLWETLAIIGCAQILTIPWIGRSTRFRLFALFGLMALHAVISYYFNWDYVHGLPNWLDDLLGTSGKRAWDGGTFGLINWSALIVAGSLAHDYVMSRDTAAKAMPGLIIAGILIATAGWLLTGLSRLYDVPVDATSEMKAQKLADSPIIPDFSRLKNASWKEIKPDLPMVPVPGPEVRKFSYWLIYKRMVSIPFVVFNIGIASVLLGLSILACDMLHFRCGMLERFGQNALAVYFVHHYIGEFQHLFVPKDSPAWWCWLNLAIFMFAINRVIAWMQRNNIRFTV